MKLYEETASSEVLFRGAIVTLRKDTARLENGALANREVVEHPGGVCVVALEEDGTVYTVKQFRYPFGQVIEELPAGKLDGKEEPRLAAERELSEEVGLTATDWVYLGGTLPSPGFCTEVLHIYLARGLTAGHQHLDEDEFLNVERHSLDELTERVMNGNICDMKSVAAILKAREYLRREGQV